MNRLELEEYEPYPENVTLDKEQRRALIEDAHIEVRFSPDEDGTYRLNPSSYIGALNVGELAVVVRPKLPIDRVMFLIAYAMDPKNWRRNTAELAREDDVLEAIALAFAHRTREAIRLGLLQGYRREEDALNTVRGRIRFGDQINRRFGVPLPIEVAFEEFTEDIEKNRLLKTAIYLLGHTYMRSKPVKQGVRRLWPAFSTVSLSSYGRGALPELPYTRLDEHYRPSVELARLIIEHSSLELFHGKVIGAAFFIDMNKVFERFLYVALRESLKLSESQWKHEAYLTLDKDDRIRMKPDLSWWLANSGQNEPRPIFVGDAKYKKLEPLGFENADIYQMLAYCTATELSSGLLVYGTGDGKPGAYKIKPGDKTIEVRVLDLSGTPDEILKRVDCLAAVARKNAMRQAARHSVTWGTSFAVATG